jgi:hypothetical protein
VTTTDTKDLTRPTGRAARTAALAALLGWVLGTPLQVTGELLFPPEEGIGPANALAVTVWGTAMLLIALGLAALGRRHAVPAATAACVLAVATLVLFYFTPGAVILGASAWFLGKDQGRGGRVAGLIGGLVALAWTVTSIAWLIGEFIG